MSSSDWALVTFGAGLPNWRAAAKRLASEAWSSAWFREIVVVTDRELATHYSTFARKHSEVLRLRHRGFGYWIWKPFVIQQVMRSLSPRVAGVVYLDAGFQLNFSEPACDLKMNAYKERARDQGVFAMHLEGYREFEWTKLLTMNRLGLSDMQRQSWQVQATPFVSTDDRGHSLIEEWLSISLEDDYLYVRDPGIDEPRAPGFIAHRHDQSIFSGLCKRREVETIADETFWAPKWQESGADYPLWAARNRSRFAVNDPRVLARAARFSELAYSRIVMNLATRR